MSLRVLSKIVPVSCALLMSMCLTSGLASAEPPAVVIPPILVGHFASLTGSEATFGQSTSNGIKLALKEINAKGGYGGQLITLKEYDDRGDAGEAKLAVERLVKSDHVVAVLGEVASKLSLAAGPVCQQAGIPMISPSSTNPKVTQVGDMIFRVSFIDPFQGYAGAKFAVENLKAKKAAVLIDQAQAYSVGLGEEFIKHFKSMGGTITTRQTFTGGATDFTAQLTAIRSSEPDIIYLPGYYTDIGNIALQARGLNITQPMMGGDGWDSSELVKIAKDAVEGCYFTNHYAADDPNPRVQDFIKAYKSEYSGATPDSLAACGYDAMKILFESIVRAKGTEPKTLREAISQTKDFQGVTGVISIDKDRNAKKSIAVLELTGNPPVAKHAATIKPE